MKAAICIKHGSPDGISIREIAKPTIQKNEILIKVIATSVTAGDVVLRRQSFVQFLMIWPIARFLFGIKNQRKKILGHEFSGIVDAVGEGVTKFHKGDAVLGTTGFKGGAHAEFISLPESGIIAVKPENLGFEAAAVLPIGGICALHFLLKAGINQDNRILIYGASGSIGTYAVQLAKNLRAHVTGVCSTANLELIKSFGADVVLDYTKNDIAATNEKFDVVFDSVGIFPKSKAKKILTKNGRYISTHSSPVKEKKEYLNQVLELTSNGSIKPVIDKVFLINKVREAHAYVETGRKKGNVVIKIANPAD